MSDMKQIEKNWEDLQLLKHVSEEAKKIFAKPPLLKCFKCKTKDAVNLCQLCNKPLCMKCSFFANDCYPTGPFCGRCG